MDAVVEVVWPELRSFVLVGMEKGGGGGEKEDEGEEEKKLQKEKKE